MSETNKATMRRIFDEIWNQGNMNTIDEIFSPDYVVHDFLPPDMPQNREGFRQFITAYRNAFPDLYAQVEDQIAEGDKVVARFTVRGTHQGEFMGIAPTGTEIKVTAIVIVRFKDGKNVEAWAEQDKLGLMQQLGRVPTP